MAITNPVDIINSIDSEINSLKKSIIELNEACIKYDTAYTKYINKYIYDASLLKQRMKEAVIKAVEYDE